MPAPPADSTLLPRRFQPVVAGGVALGLVALAVGYVREARLGGGLVHHDAPPAANGRFTVNINAATAAELATLPGLGPATASRIVDHRREHGPFGSLDALLDVPGVGPATLEQLRPHLRPIRSRGTHP